MKKKEKKLKNARTDKDKSNLKFWLFLSGVIFITLIVFSPALKADFVNWDDDTYIAENPVIQDLTIDNLRVMFRMDRSMIGNYHPLTELSFAINYAISGLNPTAYIATNLAIHIFNTILVFFFFYYFSEKDIIVSTLTGLLFAIHPMHVESVCWISERKDLLYVFFYLAALISYFPVIKRKSKIYYLFTLLLFTFSLLSKAQAVTFPLALLLLHIWYKKIQLKSLIIYLGPFLILSLIFGLLAISTQSDALTIVDLNIFDRIIVGSLGLVMYLIKSVVPFNLSALNPYPPDLDWPGYYYLMPVIFIGFVISIFWVFRKNKAAFFGLTFFLLTVLPVLQFLPVGMSMYAERYTYLPYLGLFFIGADFYSQMTGHRLWTINTPQYSILLVVLLVTFCFTTFQRTQVWHNSESLWSDVIQKYPHNFVAYVNITNHYIYDDQLNKAIEFADMGIQNVGHNVYFYDNKSYALMVDNRFSEALEVIESAKKNTQPDAQLFINEGDCYLALNKPEQAISSYSNALEIDPNHFMARLKRGKAYLQNPVDYSSAIIDFTNALYIQPDNIETLSLLATTYHLNGNNMNANRILEQAIALDPKNEELIKLKRSLAD